MRQGKILPLLVLFFLALGFLVPRPAPGLSRPADEARIAGQGGDGEVIFAPRPPRRRVQPPAVFVPFPVLSTSPSAFFLPDSGRISAVPDHMPLSIQPSSGAGVTRAGPSILF